MGSGAGAGDGDGVHSRVLAWERRVAGARAGDILRGIKARRARSLRDHQLSAREDAVWREQGEDAEIRLLLDINLSQSPPIVRGLRTLRLPGHGRH